MAKKIDRRGEVHGRLRVLRQDGNRSGYAVWLCECSCGKTVRVRSDGLRKGTISCGCAQKDAVIKRNTTHNMCRTPEYTSWMEMKKRVSTATVGGRNRWYVGISICVRWVNNFEAFLQDMGPMPQGKMTLDRIDSTKDYTPDNCRWASYKTQARNTNRNHMVTFQGRTQCLAAWCEEFKVKAGTIEARLRRGWPIERAFTEPIRGDNADMG